MQKIVVISTNNNPDYMFFAPYQVKAWNKYGWKVAIMITHDVDPKDLNITEGDFMILQIPKVDGVRMETLAQSGRLYASLYLSEDDLIMTCDMDLIPLTDYWKPNENDITVYGFDLTWHSYIPMGYVAMKGKKWREKLILEGGTIAELMERDFKLTDMPYKPDWETWWNHDWHLLTQRLMPHKKDIIFIDRGQINIAGATLARGRVDRYNWEETQKQPEPFIDMHCENINIKHPVKLEPFLKAWERFHG